MAPELGASPKIYAVLVPISHSHQPHSGIVYRMVQRDNAYLLPICPSTLPLLDRVGSGCGVGDL